MAKSSSVLPANRLPVPIETVERRIYLIRGHKVMLDADLAGLYRVATGNLNKAVKRNLERVYRGLPRIFAYTTGAA